MMQDPEITDAELDELEKHVKLNQYYDWPLGLSPVDVTRLIKALRACRARSKAKDAVVETTRKLEYEIDQTYDVDEGHPNYPFGREWRDVRRALAALGKGPDD